MSEEEETGQKTPKIVMDDREPEDIKQWLEKEGVAVEKRRLEVGDFIISSDVVVERNSQKGIIIGKGGTALKSIGRQARKAIEEFLQTPVFLELHVIVRKQWREDPAMLRRFGYRSIRE